MSRRSRAWRRREPTSHRRSATESWERTWTRRRTRTRATRLLGDTALSNKGMKQTKPGQLRSFAAYPRCWADRRRGVAERSTGGGMNSGDAGADHRVGVASGYLRQSPWFMHAGLQVFVWIRNPGLRVVIGLHLAGALCPIIACLSQWWREALVSRVYRSRWFQPRGSSWYIFPFAGLAPILRDRARVLLSVVTLVSRSCVLAVSGARCSRRGGVARGGGDAASQISRGIDEAGEQGDEADEARANWSFAAYPQCWADQWRCDVAFVPTKGGSQRGLAS